MKIAIVGSGYVGLVTGTCFADAGNDVICIDIDQDRVDSLNRGEDADRPVLVGTSRSVSSSATAFSVRPFDLMARMSSTNSARAASAAGSISDSPDEPDEFSPASGEPQAASSNGIQTRSERGKANMAWRLLQMRDHKPAVRL